MTCPRAGVKTPPAVGEWITDAPPSVLHLLAACDHLSGLVLA
jgi:hypothetical protein